MSFMPYAPLQQLQVQQELLQERIKNADSLIPMEDEFLRQRHQRHMAALHRLLAQVEAALTKIEDHTYGRCDACEQAIPEDDLAHNPSTSLCRSCRGHVPPAT
ncbi:MAG: TraR/DksA family transcriptional regulator [Candidatus Dormibacteria bacterium]